MIDIFNAAIWSSLILCFVGVAYWISNIPFDKSTVIDDTEDMQQAIAGAMFAQIKSCQVDELEG